MGRKYTANILSVGPSQWIEKGLMSQVGVSVLSGSSYSYRTEQEIDNGMRNPIGEPTMEAADDG